MCNYYLKDHKMKIINDTNTTLEYVVTPSGTTLPNSKVLASGRVWRNTARDVDINASEQVPNVYVKPVEDNNENFAFRQVSGLNSTVRITITEE